MMFELSLDGAFPEPARSQVTIVGAKYHNINLKSFIIARAHRMESVRTPILITPYPTGRLFGGGAVPGTSCQAAVVPSLRDISR